MGLRCWLKRMCQPDVGEPTQNVVATGRVGVGLEAVADEWRGGVEDVVHADHGGGLPQAPLELVAEKNVGREVRADRSLEGRVLVAEAQTRERTVETSIAALFRATDV